MNDLFAGWRFAWHRLRAGWRFMMIAAVGVVAAAALLALAPIYTSAMSDLGLRYRLDRDLVTPSDRFVRIEVDGLVLGSAPDRARRDAIDRVTEARIGWLASEILVEDRSARMVLTFPDYAREEPESPVAVPEDVGEPVRQPWGAFLFSVTAFAEHVEVVEGRLPGSGGAEVVVPEGFRRHAAVGDVVRLEGPVYDDCPAVPPSEDPETLRDEVRCVPTASALTTATATIVGFVRPRDEHDPRWTVLQAEWAAPDQPFLPRMDHLTADDELFRARALRGEGSMPLFTTHEQFFEVFATRLPELQWRHRTGFLLDTGAIRLPDVPAAITDLRGWRTDVTQGLNLPGAARTVPLDALERFRNLQTFSQIPLLLILLQVVGIVLYYVVIVMAMLLERQSEEMGVYRSRGATTTQLVGFYVVEGLVLAIPALLIGPWIAAGIVALLGFTPLFQPTTGAALLPASVSAQAYLLAAAGAAIALLAVLLPAFVVARRGIIDVKREQARPATQGLVQRYYLDFAVVALAGVLLWQLGQRGSVFDPGSVGGWSSDPLLLLSPLVVTVAVALLVLRFYPPLVRITVRLALLIRGTAVAIGLRRAGRAPASYARLVLLLIMAAAVGTFAASYGPTVDRSLDERARYEAGVALRAPLRDAREPAPGALEAVRDHPAVADAALVHRGTVMTPEGRTIPLLAVDVPRAQSMLWAREDFVAGPFQHALSALGARAPGGGIELPAGAVSFEMAIQSERLERAFIRARFRDADGRFHHRVLRPPEEVENGVEEAAEDEGAWVIASSDDLPGGAAQPLTFIGLLVTDRTGQNLRQAGSLRFDALSAVMPDGSRVVVEDFEGPFNWMMFSARQLDEEFEITRADAYSGNQSAEWTWAQVIMPGRRVLAPIDPAVPLPVIADARAVGVLGTQRGGIGNIVIEDVRVPVNVREVTEFFPTLEPGSGYLVVNREYIRSIAGTVDHGSLLVPTELWIDFAPGTSLREQEEVLGWLGSRESPIGVMGNRSVHRDAMRDETRSNPTLRASGSGILVVAFGAVLGLSMLGFVVTLVLGARARTLEFAVLRAIGSSPREILRALVLEWGVVLAVGAGIGLLLGRQVARLMLSFLEVTEEGTRVLPPFVLVTDWLTLGIGAAALLAVVAAGLGLAWLSSMRRATASELRLTR